MSITYRVLRTVQLTIPEGASIWGGVLDDVDDDGRPYNREIAGPCTVLVGLTEETIDEPAWQQKCTWWDAPDEAVGWTEDAFDDLLAEAPGDGITVTEGAPHAKGHA